MDFLSFAAGLARAGRRTYGMVGGSPIRPEGRSDFAGFE